MSERTEIVTVNNLVGAMNEYRPNQLYISIFGKGVNLIAKEFKYYEVNDTLLFDFTDNLGGKWEMNSVSDMYRYLIKPEIDDNEENFDCLIFGFEK